jgi:SRSO17 transposase
MPGIIEFPKLVQDAVARYADLFANECQRRHFAEYLTGLIVAERKTVLGINGEFARTTDQSCLNRFLTAADWDVHDLNRRRLDELQNGEGARKVRRAAAKSAAPCPWNSPPHGGRQLPSQLPRASRGEGRC